ncbi:GTP-binding protein [Prosthecobacter sp. SYSU 5D2]|uniref:GTP-binding protein n=1 Tax=Prosthecobacter sp. SYSU 5D2 TaxID=3134134 RepID=UPI0031FE84BF
MKFHLDAEEWARRLSLGDRQALSRAITLAESSLEKDQEMASRLFAALPKPMENSLRIGVTGAPGAGKSSLIEAVGLRLCSQGHRVAVLTLDPSSTVHGGSLLGDKTRMHELSHHPASYVRPTPSGGVLGGIGIATFSALTLCEAAGFEILFVETVGTGQSEYSVIDVTDVTLLVMDPGSGDGVQMLKKGLLEHVDWIAISKADGERRSQAEALHIEFLNSPSSRPVLLTSQEDEAVINQWARRIQEHRQTSGNLRLRRHEQAQKAFRWTFEQMLIQQLRANPEVDGESVLFAESNTLSPQLVTHAAQTLIRRLI